jgi:phytoene dehydrogenase-like protein
MQTSAYVYDVLVIGAGISGLLTACRLGQAGKNVLLVDKLSFLGGRFSAFPYQGAEISSGAFHTIPHGAEGPFAQALSRLGISLAMHRSPVFASFFYNRQQFTARTGFQVVNLFDAPADRRMIWRTFFHLWFSPNFPGTMACWLEHLGASDAVKRLFDRFCQFALSTTLDQVSYREGRAISEALIRYGLPGVPIGGARAVVRQLSRAVSAAGVDIWKTAQVEQILMDGGQICGAMIHHRKTGRNVQVQVPLIVSSIGPQLTRQLLDTAGRLPLGAAALASIPPATGLKIHVLSPTSLIDHAAILFCLDTRRIAGIIQVTNADPSLAPPGKHLLISHQVLAPGADWQHEQALALHDWRDIFGAQFEACTILGVSQFCERFPVNWAVQGCDLRHQPFASQGLWLVGDGMKPMGLMMIEGVAASAESTANQILGLPDLTPWMPTKNEEIHTWMKRFSNHIRGGKHG